MLFLAVTKTIKRSEIVPKSDQIPENPVIILHNCHINSYATPLPPCYHFILWTNRINWTEIGQDIEKSGPFCRPYGGIFLIELYSVNPSHFSDKKVLREALTDTNRGG